jgi:bifunctional DNase/RNase
LIEMTIESVRINLATQQRVAILKAKTQERHLFIWIAHAEAYAIAIELQGTTSLRPLTHDLLKNVINGMGGNILRVEVSDLVDDIFYARIVVDVAGKQVDFDARPSDAFAIAVRAKTPIFVEESVLERAGVTLDANEGPQPNEPETKEKEQVVVDAFPNEMTLVRKENEALKEQLAQLQNELASAQKRITELESEDLPPSTNSG